MRLCIDYTAAYHQSAGIGRYVRELTAALSANYFQSDDGGNALALFVAGADKDPPAHPPGTSVFTSKLSERNHARIWGRLRLPIPVEWWTGKFDVFHEPDFFLPPTMPQTRKILTIHDLAFEKYPQETMPGMLYRLKRDVSASARRADAIIAVSDATRHDILELYKVSPDRVITIPHGVSERFFELDSSRTSAVRQKYAIPDGPMILTVGTLQPRKNHLRLVEAFAYVGRDSVLVIAGGTGWAYEEVIHEKEKLGLSGRVILTGPVAEEDLPALYHAASIFAYPALYEGFGMPVLEAMAAGVPVVVSNSSSLPEVVGDAGLLVDPLNVDQLADAIGRLLDSPSLRQTLGEISVRRAREFTWAQAAARTMSVYRGL